MNSFSYAGESLENCEYPNGTARIGAYGPPIGSPRLDWELPSKQTQEVLVLNVMLLSTLQVTCQIDGALNATFSPVEIVLFNGPDEVQDGERRRRYAVPLWNNVCPPRPIQTLCLNVFLHFRS